MNGLEMNPTHEVQQQLHRALQFDIDVLRRQLYEARRESKALRVKLRRVLNCVDLKCSLCAGCLDAIREAE